MWTEAPPSYSFLLLCKQPFVIHPRASWLLGGDTGRDGGAPEELEAGVYNENGHQEEGTDETRKGNDNSQSSHQTLRRRRDSKGRWGSRDWWKAWELGPGDSIQQAQVLRGTLGVLFRYVESLKDQDISFKHSDFWPPWKR